MKSSYGYTSGSTPMHKADALIKLLCLISVIVSVILSDSGLAFAFSCVPLLFAALLSGAGLKNAFGGLFRLWLFFLTVLFMNFAFFSPENAFFSFWIFSFSFEGLIFGTKTVLRVVFIMAAANIFIFCTSPGEIVPALETLIYPLKFIGVPIRDVSMILGTAFRFVPEFSREAAIIKTAQTARGARFQSKNLFDRAKSLTPLVIPVFVSAFNSADELSLAMEARGYERKKGKMKLKKRSIGSVDMVMLFVCAGVMLGVGLIK